MLPLGRWPFPFFFFFPVTFFLAASEAIGDHNSRKDATYILLCGPLIYNYFHYLCAPEKKRKKMEQAFCASAKKKNNWVCLRCPCVICRKATVVLLLQFIFSLLLPMFWECSIPTIFRLCLRLPMKFYAWFFFGGMWGRNCCCRLHKSSDLSKASVEGNNMLTLIPLAVRRDFPENLLYCIPLGLWNIWRV